MNAVCYYSRSNIRFKIDDRNLLKIISDKDFSNEKFEILSEEDKEIDIQAIELMEHNFHETEGEDDIKEKINELIKAVKQLDIKLNKGEQYGRN